MKSETRHCQNCKQEFAIEPDDFGFYKKMDLQIPRLCPPCRMQLRLSFKNERNLYKNNCGNCDKAIITVWSPTKTFPVWCYECWWSDSLNEKSYAQDYDPKRPFFEQFAELFVRVPKPAKFGMRNVNMDYFTYAADNKGCYMVFECSNNEDCINCYWIQLSKNLVDCSFTHKVELSYNVDDCYDSHSLLYSKSCYNCFDSAFLLDCRNCNDCLGSINLRGQKYNIFNKQYTKEDYREKLKSYRLDTCTGVEKFKKEFQEFIKDKPRKYAEIFNEINSTGNYLKDVRNVRNCFHAYEAED